MKNCKRGLSLLLMLCMQLILLPQFALVDTSSASEQSLLPTSTYLAPGATIVLTGTVGEDGAPWRLYSDGTLKVDEGFIYQDGGGWLALSPWHELSMDFQRIVFTGPITAGASLNSLFAGLGITDIEGLEYFDTSNVTDMQNMFGGVMNLSRLDLSGWDTRNVKNMSGMFFNARSLTSLDLSSFDTSSATNMESMFRLLPYLRSIDVSGFDTSNVINMALMFDGTSSLTSLDLSNWDTRNVIDMDRMFSNMHALRTLSLGEHFRFVQQYMSEDASLPTVQQNFKYTGKWQNISDGTIERPTGMSLMTSADLIGSFDGRTMADTWVWQRVDPMQGTHRVTFNLNGGAYLDNGANIVRTLQHGLHIGTNPMPTPERTGHTFAGWQLDGAGAVLSCADVAAMTVEQNLTFIAVMERTLSCDRGGCEQDFHVRNLRHRSGSFSWWPTVAVITTFDALSQLNFSIEVTNRYSAAFFETHYLVIVSVGESSGSNRLNVERIDSNGDIIIRRDAPGLGTTDIAYWDLVIELCRSFQPERFRPVGLHDHGNDLVRGGFDANKIVHIGFDTNGGTPKWQEMSVEAGKYMEQVIQYVRPPARVGYTFTGWTNQDGIQVNLQMTVTEAMRLYAGWEPVQQGLFTDVEQLWAYDAIQFVYENSLMTGTSSTTFAPNETLTRAMAAGILWRLEGEPMVTYQNAFSDIWSVEPAWYRYAVIRAFENGIVQGFGDRFEPYGTITRDAFASMLHRYAQLIGVDVTVPESVTLNQFTDKDTVSAWAIDYMRWAVYHELIAGTTSTTLDPSSSVTRAQAAVILMRFTQMIADN